MKKAIVLFGKRTPFVSAWKEFEDCESLELLASVVNSMIYEYDFSINDIDEVIIGSVFPFANSPNLARSLVFHLGMPKKIEAQTIQQDSLSGLQALYISYLKIITGTHKLSIACGVDSTSDTPIFYSKKARKFLNKFKKAISTGAKINIMKDFNAKAFIPASSTFMDLSTKKSIFELYEQFAISENISKEQQNIYALSSYKKAKKHFEQGTEELSIVPIWAPPHYQKMIKFDGFLNEKITMESLNAQEGMVFKEDGSVTSGNTSFLADGAAGCLIGSSDYYQSSSSEEQFYLKDFNFFSYSLKDMLFEGMAYAILELLKKNHLTLKDIDLFELHESSAAVILGTMKKLNSPEFRKKFDLDKNFGFLDESLVNVNGGAIVFGHCQGASPIRMVLNIIDELKKRNKQRGIVALESKNGQAGAVLVERL